MHYHFVSLVLGLFGSVLISVKAVPIDNGVLGKEFYTIFGVNNGVLGTPKIECGTESITINVTTRNPFLGRIFVKGASHKSECSKKYVNNTEMTNAGTLEIKFANCGMQRQRKLSPSPIMEESLTVIISFHYLFITKVDKAYNIQCVYGPQSSATVFYNFNVSMIPTELLNIGAGPMPECAYEIRKDSINGPLVQYAEVGDQLFHRWMCFGDVKILVRNCYVTDGAGVEKFLVVDTRGCAIDYNVLGDLKYDTNGKSAWIEAHAFKFADTTTVAFACTIKVCTPSKEDCDDTTPPQCSLFSSGRPKPGRQHDFVPIATSKDDEVDVSAPSFNVLDHRLTVESNSYEDNNISNSQDIKEVNYDSSKSSKRYTTTTTATSADICLSKIFVVAMVIAIVGTLVPLVVGMAALFTIIRRKRDYHIFM